MGQIVSAFYSWFNTDREYKVLLVGLDNAGKTTTLYQMHLGQAIETQPTIGSNVETVRHKNVHFEVSHPPRPRPRNPAFSPSGLAPRHKARL